MVKYRVKIADIREEVQGTKTFLLEKPEGFTWIEGAHTHIGLIGFDEGDTPNKNWVRHMSIITLPEENLIGFTTRIKENPSEFKDKLAKLLIGDEIILFKIGSRMYLRRENRPIVLISMGVGIATMRPIIHKFIEDQTNIPRVVNININATDDFVYRNELDKLLSVAYHNDWLSSRRDFYDLLNHVTEQTNGIFYVVGSDTFLVEVINFLRSKGISDQSILIDKKEEQFINYFK